ncbi:MAG: ABC transporter ATP-binding protein [Sumerlaeia bacterium]
MKALLALKVYLVKYRWRFLFGIVFVFFANYFSAKVPVYAGKAINGITDRATLMQELRDAALLLVCIAGLGGAFRYLMRRVLIDTSRDIEFDFRNDIYKKLQSLDATFYDGNNTGDIMSRMTNDLDMIRMVLGPAIMYTANTIFVLPIVLIQMFRLNWQVTVAGLMPLVLLPALVKIFGARLHHGYRAQQDALGDLTTYTQESLAGIRVVKAYAQEQNQERKFDAENDHYIKVSLDLAKTLAYFRPAIQLIAGSGLAIILVVGARQIMAGSLDYGDLTALLLLFGMLVWPMIAAGWVINLYQRANSAMERIAGITEAKSMVGDSPTAVSAADLPGDLDVEFRDLTFAYPGAEEEPVLKNITLKIPSGTTLGIIGRVGAGKSTLVHLLLRLYPVERGQLFLGGIDINDWPLAELRRRVAIVFQETFLFSDTLSENIRFGALSELTQEQIEDAARQANVHDDIAGFPKGYETMLGERGINLSGGQKQRTAIARALVRDSSLLILDDALSAVDTQTEEQILGHLETVMANRSVFLISHRISTVSMADHIIVLEDGVITAQGRHESLLAQPGLYTELHRKQLLEEEVEAIG